MDNKEEIWKKISDLWDPLNPEQREYLTQNLVVYTFKKDEPIYSEGDFPTRLMCLLDGKVKIFKNGTSGRNQIIRVIKPVEYFAYRAYFAHQRYLTAAAAFETSTIGMIPMSTIMHLVRENNDLAWFFIQQLSIDLGIADERTVNLTQKHIRGRLAESLLFLKESGVHKNLPPVALITITAAAMYGEHRSILPYPVKRPSFRKHQKLHIPAIFHTYHTFPMLQQMPGRWSLFLFSRLFYNPL